MIRNTLACLVAEAGVADVPVRLRQDPPYQAMPLAGIRRGRKRVAARTVGWRSWHPSQVIDCTSSPDQQAPQRHDRPGRPSANYVCPDRRIISSTWRDLSSRWRVVGPGHASLGYAPDRVRDARAPAGHHWKGGLAIATCSSGYPSADCNNFCGACAAQFSGRLICMNGHVNRENQPFCGECGVRADGAVAVRMQQTGRSNSDCVGYLQRPSDSWTAVE